MRTITLREMKEEIAEDLRWIAENDPTTWDAWASATDGEDDGRPVEVHETEDETVYVLRDAGAEAQDFALATYGQSEPRLVAGYGDED